MHLPDPNPCETPRVQGEWIVDAKFGRFPSIDNVYSIYHSPLIATIALSMDMRYRLNLEAIIEDRFLMII